LRGGFFDVGVILGVRSEEDAAENRNEVQPDQQSRRPRIPAALALSVDDFSALEERILRAVTW
jgi:hypothetical protein